MLDIPKLPSDTFQVRYSQLLNAVPQCIHKLPSYPYYKKEIRRHLMNLDTTVSHLAVKGNFNFNFYSYLLTEWLDTWTYYESINYGMKL